MRVKAAALEHLPRLSFPRDFDYVEGLAEMRHILLQLHNQRCVFEDGAEAPPAQAATAVRLLVEKARHLVDMAAFPFARDAADSALRLNSSCVEAHYLRGLAFVGMALNQLDLLAPGPALWGVHEATDTWAMDHLEDARLSLTQCVELTSGGDQEAADLLDYLARLEDSPSDDDLRDHLRPLLG